MEDPKSPLPSSRVLDGTMIRGRIKARHEDFFVEELPLYQPTGEGEHLYLFIQKRGMPHTELVRVLRQHFRVPENAIGFAGMKDKLAVTRQQVSIHLPSSEPESLEIFDKRVEVLWATRHNNKLRRGHLSGNRFAIRLRDADPLKAPFVMKCLRELERTGIPNYYGVQRFGYRRNTHRLGLLVVCREWDALVAELLGSRGSSFPERQRAARELVDEGKYQESLPLWTRNEFAERVVLKALASGATSEQAVRSISKYTVTFWVSALQSAIFNRVLDLRVDEKRLNKVEAGDVAMRHDSRRQFIVQDDAMKDPEFLKGVEEFQISATGPMWGKHMLMPYGQARQAEVDALSYVGVTADEMERCSFNPRGTRRPLRIGIDNIEVDSGVDEEGGYIRMAFDLPRGSYATVVMREFIDNIDAAEEEATESS